jgi:hypothetical protein
MAGNYLQSLMGEREQVILTTRHHWFILVSSIVLEIFLILIIFTLTLWGSITLAAQQSPAVLIVAIIGFFIMLIPMVTGTRDVLNWTNHQFIITNRRVMQISGIFNKTSLTSLEKVSDMKWKYCTWQDVRLWDLEILTCSELGVIKFSKSTIRSN